MCVNVFPGKHEVQRDRGRTGAIHIGGQQCQERYPPYEVPVGVCAAPKAHGAVAVEKLLEK